MAMLYHLNFSDIIQCYTVHIAMVIQQLYHISNVLRCVPATQSFMHALSLILDFVIST